MENYSCGLQAASPSLKLHIIRETNESRGFVLTCHWRHHSSELRYVTRHVYYRGSGILVPRALATVKSTPFR